LAALLRIAPTPYVAAGSPRRWLVMPPLRATASSGSPFRGCALRHVVRHAGAVFDPPASGSTRWWRVGVSLDNPAVNSIRLPVARHPGGWWARSACVSSQHTLVASIRPHVARHAGSWLYPPTCGSTRWRRARFGLHVVRQACGKLDQPGCGSTPWRPVWWWVRSPSVSLETRR
jgi:hypothetical protein